MTTRAAEVFAQAVDALYDARVGFNAWRFLDVRPSTVQQWKSGRRTYPPAVLGQLEELLADTKPTGNVVAARSAVARYLGKDSP